MSIVRSDTPELTPELSARLLDGARSGLFLGAVAEACGIDPDVLSTWIQMGLSRGSTEPYRSFAKFYRAAERSSQVAAVKAWHDAVRAGDWQAAKAWLACRWPEEWGPKPTAAIQAGQLKPTAKDQDLDADMMRQVLRARPPELLQLLREELGVDLESGDSE